MTEVSHYLLTIARRIADAYSALPGAQAVMVTGSVALRESDFYSDVDMTVYYDALPTEEELTAARERTGSQDPRWIGGSRADGSFAESFTLAGVECQVGHTTVEAWEREIAGVLGARDVQSPMQKALSGILDCTPLFGEAHIRRWKAMAADYPDLLARAMVEQHLSFFPLWAIQERLDARDAVLWRHQALLEAAQNVLGVLAGLNRLYYSTFQFKRMGKFIREMRVAPPDLAARLEGLLSAPPREAAERLAELVDETTALVEQEMPDIDTSGIRRWLGVRVQPWIFVLEQE